jgi:hypothetical protein
MRDRQEKVLGAFDEMFAICCLLYVGCLEQRPIADPPPNAVVTMDDMCYHSIHRDRLPILNSREDIVKEGIR